MTHFARYLLWMPLVLAVSAADQNGIDPRRVVEDYPAHSERSHVSVGAALLTPEQVRGSFVTDLNRGYLVVELAVYPRDRVSINHLDFLLRESGTDHSSRPVAGKVIAGVLQKKTDTSARDVTLYPTVGVGYSTGPSYDPAYGRTRGGGWDTSVGVGVGMGGNGPAPASTPQDRHTMELELSEKGLPQGSFDRPVAGYLYFPVPTKKKDVSYSLEFRIDGERFLVPFPHVAGKH